MKGTTPKEHALSPVDNYQEKLERLKASNRFVVGEDVAMIAYNKTDQYPKSQCLPQRRTICSRFFI